MGSAEKLFLLVWAAILFGPAVKAALKKSKTPPKRPHSSLPPRPPLTILRRRPDSSARSGAAQKLPTWFGPPCASSRTFQSIQRDMPASRLPMMSWA